MDKGDGPSGLPGGERNQGTCPRGLNTFCDKTPVVVVNNQCVIVTGASLLNAYDRLEVLEYSAAAVIAARDIGEIVLITPEEVDAIEEAFHLK